MSVGGLLLLLGMLQLGHRGMQRVRNDIPLWDFLSVHSAARTWLHGGDPYDLPRVLDTWHEAGIFSDRDASYFATVYLPCSLVMLAPLAALPATVAMGIWIVLMITLLVLQLAALADLANLRWRDGRTLLLVGATIASAPLQFGLLSGQLSIPAISLCVLAFWCAARGGDRLSGVLLGLACALKPQIGGPFVLYYFFLRRYRLVGAAAIVGGVICLVAVGAMQLSQINWLEGWGRSVSATTQIGGVNDYGWTGEFRDQIVDLKMLLVSIVHQPWLLRAIVWAGVGVLMAWYVAIHPRRQERAAHTQLLALAGFSAIALLPVYHRVYDVSLLSLGLAWALAALDGPPRRYSMGVLALMMIFLIPFDVVRTTAKRIPELMTASKTGWWQSLIAPHYAWGLLLLTILLLLALTHVRRASVK